MSIRTYLILMFLSVLALIFFALKAVNAEDMLSEVKLKGKPALRVKITEVAKDSISYRINDSTVTVKAEDIEYIKNVDKNDSKFKKTIILTNEHYYSGVVIYQDRQKISVEVKGDLSSFKNEEISDIVSESDFNDELSRTKWKAAGLSCLFPGAGQLYSRRYTSGVVLGSTFLASMVTGICSYYSAQKDWGKYEDSNYMNKSKYRSYRNKMYVSSGASIVAVGIYAFSIFDAAYNFRHKYDILDKNNNASTTTTVSATNNYIGIQAVRKF